MKPSFDNLLKILRFYDKGNQNESCFFYIK